MAPDKHKHPPLDRLNDRERELLSLLGSGHTAKSIATLKGLSVAAVNERFRNARRKTGLASSREVARLVVAQESRDDFIGLAQTATPPASLPRPDAPRSRRASPLRRWRLPMIASGLIAIAILAQQTSAPPEPPAPQTGTMPADASTIFARRAAEPDLAQLHAEVLVGRPDPSWSPSTEATLHRRHNQIAGFDDSVQSFSVTCAGSLCEVLGTTRSGLSIDRSSGLMEALAELGPQAGLHQLAWGFTTSNDDRTSFVFASYWRRRD